LYLGANPLDDLSPLSRLVNLASRSLRDLAPLATLLNLHSLDLDPTGNDFTPFSRLPHLEIMSVPSTVTQTELDRIPKLLPYCLIARLVRM
jgi:hypothetical protein